MSEVIGFSNGRTTLIYSPHSTELQFKNGMPAWPQEVNELLVQCSPMVIAIDGVVADYLIPDMNRVVPVDDLNAFPKGLHVIGADPGIFEKDESSIEWESVRKSVNKLDLDFDPDLNNEPFSTTMGHQYVVEEGVVYGGLAALGARVLWQEYKSREKNPPRRFPRRDFLKLVALVSAVAFTDLGRVLLFFNNIRKIRATDGSPSTEDILIQATKPLLSNIPWIDPWTRIRNAKVGLAVMTELKQPGLTEEKGVIIFGNAHQIDEYPGQKSNETLEQAIKRLSDVMRGGFEEIIKYNKAGEKIVSPKAMEATLIKIFATRDIYLPQKEEGSNTNFKWIKWDKNLIPEVVQVIHEVVAEKYKKL